MKKENDEITDLFRTRLTDTQMPVRDGFWEELSQDIPAACQQHRRLLLFRIAAAASVLLVLAASSATFWYLSSEDEIGETFTQMAVSRHGALDGDGVLVNRLPRPVVPVLTKPAPRSYGMMAQGADEDSLSFSFSMSFTFTSAESEHRERRRPHDFWQVSDEQTVSETSAEAKEYDVTHQPVQEKVVKKPQWAMKVQAGTALPAENGTYKMPVSAGVTVERKLNKYLAVEAGLMYSHLHSEAQSLHYLGIPLKMNFTLIDTKKVDMYATIGGIADKCIAGAPDNGFKEEPIQLAVTAGIGVNYKINDRFALFAEPGVSRHFKTDSKLATVRTKRPTNFNLLCGLRMTY